jgi:hypothetical protein
VVRGAKALVQETATRNGYSYPKIYEYGRDSAWQREKGPRPFLEPALEAKQGEVLFALDEMLARAQIKFGMGGQL